MEMRLGEGRPGEPITVCLGPSYLGEQVLAPPALDHWIGQDVPLRRWRGGDQKGTAHVTGVRYAADQPGQAYITCVLDVDPRGLLDSFGWAIASDIRAG